MCLELIPIRIGMPRIRQNYSDPTRSGSTTLPELHKINADPETLPASVYKCQQKISHTNTQIIHHNLTVVNVGGGAISKLFKLHWNVCNPTRTLTAIRLNSKLSRRSLGLIFRPNRIANPVQISCNYKQSKKYMYPRLFTEPYNFRLIRQRDIHRIQTLLPRAKVFSPVPYRTVNFLSSICSECI
jgi:hypothetical protein